ncbi:MAG TPA: hypothetical protein DCW74_18335 [Alteromonas australica]|uniref:Terminase large subunit gp17-like C-terminal domain-containing protein n=1 Tax=Alteromonas australica TaxID=589873 RepID=A0A350P8R3_9ALTE|nr:hypothetical protein [Alteromonas australica]
MWVEPTYQLVKRVAIAEWSQTLRQLGIPFEEHKADNAMTVGPRGQQFKVYFYSAQHPERIVGQTASWAVIDESALVSEKVFANVLARVRDPKAKLSQICCVSTPEGFNWLWKTFVKNATSQTRLIKAKTSDNPFLPPEYLDTLREQYTELEFSQYCEGEFIAMSGSVYSRFDRNVHIKQLQSPLQGDLVVGADFNIGKMAWVIGSNLGDKLHFFDEQITHNRNTEEAAELLDQKLRGIYFQAGLTYKPREIRIYCDASGAARKTSASRSDTAILRSFGWRVMHHPANPAIRDRVNAVNVAFLKQRLYIDPKATYLMQCIEQQGYDQSGLPEKNGLDHGADAIGYAVSYIMPVMGRKPTTRKYM